LATPNYGYEKRQKELAKKKKKEDKLKNKADRKVGEGAEDELLDENGNPVAAESDDAAEPGTENPAI
jgi:hypothetical protein